MSERQGVEIDYCPKCRGVWLDRSELDKIIERSDGGESQYPERPERGRDRQDRDNRNRNNDDEEGGGFLDNIFGGFGGGRDDD